MFMRTPMMALGALMLSLALVVGCETSRMGVTNTAGTYDTTVKGTTIETTEAATEVFKDMEFTIVESKSSDVDGMVTARTARDVLVKVTVTNEGEDLSNLSVRVGDFGDEAMSLMIIDKIKAEL